MVSAITLTLLLAGMFALAFDIQSVSANGTIYIRTDGSIDPPTASLATVDNVTYTFTGDINDSILVERDNIMLDGRGYSLQGSGIQRPSTGVQLSGRSNVTIKNIEIKGFSYGVFLDSSLNNSIIENNITDTYWDVFLTTSSCNLIMGNNFTFFYFGIEMERSSENNDVSANNMIHNSSITVPYFNTVSLSSSNNNIVSENNLSAEGVQGIYLYRSSNNGIFANNITANSVVAIWLEESSNNSLIGNRLGTDDSGGTLALTQSSGNILRNNRIIHDKKKGTFGVLGQNLSDFINDIDSSNTIDGKPIYYWVNEQAKMVPSDAKFVALINCSSIRVENLTLKNNFQGILIAYTHDCTISGNIIQDNIHGIYCYHTYETSLLDNSFVSNIDTSVYVLGLSNYTDIVRNNISKSYWGIYLESSAYNTIYRNNITNVVYGIRVDAGLANSIWENIIAGNQGALGLTNSWNNSIYHNYFANNAPQAFVQNSINSWDNGYSSGGNYWSDYNGTDIYSGPYQNETGSDGIGDTPYSIDTNNTDKYPLMKPYRAISLLGDMNLDGTVDISDAILAARAFGSGPEQPNWNSRADFNNDGIIDIFDLIVLANNFGKIIV